MPVFIYDSIRFHKKLHKMKKAGGKAKDAAEQAWRLILLVAAEERITSWLKGKLTNYGEGRLQNGGKFDLGGGYRLIFVKKDRKFIFLYLGSHNECNIWIWNNRGIEPDLDQAKIIYSPKDHNEPDSGELDRDPVDTPDMDLPLHEFIDQQTLREIFPGICQRTV